MKIGYFPSIKAIVHGKSVRHSIQRASYKSKPIRVDRPDSRRLGIDDHTARDLELFESEGTHSLFDLCNFTRTQGGAEILKQRMREPFADLESIKRAQDSIVHILENRELYAELKCWIPSRVDRYQRDPLMFVINKNRFGFFVGATVLKMFDSHHFFRILRGVQFSCLLIQSLREFVAQLRQHNPVGEILYICDDLEEILDSPSFLEVPSSEPKGLKYWKILRLDQAFRIYEKEKTYELLRLVYELDALISLADATSKRGYILPTVTSGPTRVEARGLINAQLRYPIANDLCLDQSSKLLFLTGPNMAGKTTYLRAIATALYFAHLGMGVPAKEFVFTPVDHLFSSLSISDNLHTGTSYFLAEVLRIKAVAEAVAAGAKVIAIMDEPFKGTNVKDALEASYAVIERLQSKSDSLFLFSSHLIELDEKFGPSKQIQRCHFEAKESGGRLKFDYRLHPGISTQRMGMRVLTDQGVFALLDSRVQQARSGNNVSVSSEGA